MKYLFHIFLFFVSFSLIADDYLLEYTDGSVQYSSGSGWEEAYIGDYVPGNSDIKIDSDTYAEFSRNNIKLTITEQGTYKLDNLFNKSEEIADWSIASLIGDKVERLVGINQEDLDVTHMAVRGDQIPGTRTDDDAWMDEHTELIDEVKRLLGQGNYNNALDELLIEYSFSYGRDKEEICFYIGYIYSILEEDSKALKYFSEIEIDYTRPYFSDLVLVKGNLLVENLLFDDAIELFETYIDNYPGGEKTQYAYFLTAVCYTGLNNTYKTKVYLEKAVNEDPDSEIGRAAANHIENM
jgi:tetratricopeptide (TPR) repeat protein